jgi:hypothetical protein
MQNPHPADNVFIIEGRVGFIEFTKLRKMMPRIDNLRQYEKAHIKRCKYRINKEVLPERSVENKIEFTHRKCFLPTSRQFTIGNRLQLCSFFTVLLLILDKLGIPFGFKSCTSWGVAAPVPKKNPDSL